MNGTPKQFPRARATPSRYGHETGNDQSVRFIHARLLAACVAVLIPCAAPVAAQANSYTQDLSVSLSPSQLSTKEVITSPGPIKTVWDSANQPLTLAALSSGDTLTVNLKFNGFLRATDQQNPVDTREMIYWFLDGTGYLSAAQDMPYGWQFTSASGVLLSSTLSGTGVLRTVNGWAQGAINVSQTFEGSNLTDGSFCFGGIRLTLTMPQIPSGWTPTTVRLAFASDSLVILPSRVAGKLDVSRGSPIRLSWSTNLAGLGLETKPNLSPSTPWLALTLQHALLGTNYVATNTPSDSERYYRLSNWPQRQCVSHMKQIGLALRTWALDWDDLFPFQVSTNMGGSLQWRAIGPDGFDANSYAHFQVMSNQLGTASLLVCPGDFLRKAATDFGTLRPENVTYRLCTGDTVTDSNPGAVVAVCPIDGNTLYCDGSVTSGPGY